MTQLPSLGTVSSSARANPNPNPTISQLPSTLIWQVIFREGDTSDFFYLITAGKVRMLLTTYCPLPTTHYLLLTLG